MLQISQAHNEARLGGTRTFIDDGAGSAKVVLYSGTRPLFNQPPGADSSLLVEIPLPKPCGSVSAGYLNLTAAEAMVTTSGIAKWARVINGGGITAFDCDVTDLAGAGEIKLDQTQLYAGGIARMTEGKLG